MRRHCRDVIVVIGDKVARSDLDPRRQMFVVLSRGSASIAAFSLTYLCPNHPKQETKAQTLFLWRHTVIQQTPRP